MGRPTKEAASPSPLAPALVRYAGTRGLDPSVVAERVGLAPSVAELDDAPVTSSSLASILANLADLLSEPHLALRLPSELAYRRYDAVTLAARAAGTPREVLGLLARWSALVFPQLDIRLEEGAAIATDRALAPGSGNSDLHFSATFRGQPRGLGLHVDEYVLALALGHCRRGGIELTPTSVWMSTARPRDLGPLFRALGTREFTFGAESVGFSLRREDADRPLAGADPILVATAEHLASASLMPLAPSSALADAVEAKIEAMLPGDVSTVSVAEALHMSSRTLQRRLEDEGTRFSEVFDAVRERVARRLLATDLALGEVAYRAGFSDVPTFSRAFKRWTGVPPGAFRRAPR